MSTRITLGAGAFLPMSADEYCRATECAWHCFRAPGHHGRHAAVDCNGTVMRVWGDDVHADARAKGRRKSEEPEWTARLQAILDGAHR